MTLIRFTFDKDRLKKFSTHTIVAGILMTIVGVAGIFMPAVLSLVVATLLAWLFLMSAFIQGYITFKNYRGSFSAWLKPILSLITGLIFIVFPTAGIAAVAMLLVAYLFLDAYSSFGFAMDYKPHKGWWVFILNAIVSVILAALLTIGWPANSLYWVGIFAAISLLFDGIALLTIGITLKRGQG